MYTCIHVYNVYVHVYLIIYADGPLVTLFTEPSACQITSASQPDSERDAGRTLPTTFSAIKLVYPKIVVDFLFLTSGGANSKSLR